MPTVKCPLQDCGYRNKRGYCHRTAFALQQTETRCNELYCLGWATPEMRVFDDAMTATKHGHYWPDGKTFEHSHKRGDVGHGHHGAKYMGYKPVIQIDNN